MCYQPETLPLYLVLPMMYMNDAVRAALELMAAPAENIKVRTSYNLAALSFSPEELAAEIKKTVSDFGIRYAPDFRQQIADSWPATINDRQAREDWGWQHRFGTSQIVTEMLTHVQVPAL